MAERVLMLALSPTMETGTIVNWTKNEGDQVQEGDILCEVETDKATMEYESQNEGTLLKIVVAAGREAAVGQAIAIIGDEGEDVQPVLKEIKAEEASGAEVSVPEASASEVAAASAKAFAGSDADETTGAGTGEEAESSPAKVKAADKRVVTIADTPQPSSIITGTLPEGVRASPVARRLADQHNLDIRQIQGSGPEGRIVKRDVAAVAAAAVQGGAAAGKTAPSVGGAGLSAPAIHTTTAAHIPVEMTTKKLPVSGKRKVIAQRLSESKFSAPHYYLRFIVAMDALMKSREELNKRVPEKVSFNAFIIKFVAEALRRHPMVNAGWQGDHILQYGRADIGLAVAQPDGLITPVVRDCWNRGILSIDEELRVLIDKAMNNKLKPDEYTGATFTISNLGSYGIHDFTAVINPPGAAILAVGEARREPVVGANDEIEIRTNTVLSLSCDHRVIDGAEGALFMQDLCGMMENPIQVLY
jgi:pyruvate dehydrogenase E2 component (dihydrolipoamide acetyltransferase)